jgi:hypothetical protein
LARTTSRGGSAWRRPRLHGFTGAIGVPICRATIHMEERGYVARKFCRRPAGVAATPVRLAAPRRALSRPSIVKQR